MLKKPFRNDPVDPREEGGQHLEPDGPFCSKTKPRKEELDTLDGWTDDSHER